MLSELLDYERMHQWSGSFGTALKISKVSIFLDLCQTMKNKMNRSKTKLVVHLATERAMILTQGQRKAGYWECKCDKVLTTEEVEIKLRGLHELQGICQFPAWYSERLSTCIHMKIFLIKVSSCHMNRQQQLLSLCLRSSGDRKRDPESYCTIWTSVEHSASKQMSLVDSNEYKMDSKAGKSRLNLTASFF